MISLFTESYFREAARDISETYIKTFSNNLSSYTDFDIFYPTILLIRLLLKVFLKYYLKWDFVSI